MARTLSNRLGNGSRMTRRISPAWSSSIDYKNNSLSPAHRPETPAQSPETPVLRPETDDELEASSEVALLCANIQADVGQPTPFSTLPELLQALYALTTAVATAETRPARS